MAAPHRVPPWHSAPCRGVGGATSTHLYKLPLNLLASAPPAGSSWTPQPSLLRNSQEKLASHSVSSKTQQLHYEWFALGDGSGGSGGCDVSVGRGCGAGGRMLSHARHPHTVIPGLHFQAHPVFRLSGPMYFLRPGRWWCYVLAAPPAAAAEWE